MKTVLFVLLDQFADWESAFLAPALRGGIMPGRPGRHAVRYATPGGVPVRSIGGMTLTPDCDTETLPDDCAGLILVGGMSWATPETERIVPLVREALSHGILVGAICNAASFLAAHGFLNGVRHTGNGLEMLREWGGANYTGEKLYQERQGGAGRKAGGAHQQSSEAVRDGNVLPANGSGYLEFTRECLLALEADTPEQIAASYAFNKHGFYQE